MFTNVRFFTAMLGLVFLPILVFGQSELDGIFYHEPGKKYLEIEKIQDGLLVSNPQDKKPRFFRKYRSGLFFDRRGNRIEVVHGHEIIYVKRNSTRGHHYFKIRQAYCHPSVTLPTEHPTAPGVISQNVEGLWINHNNGEYLIVVLTREGLKARLRHTRNWYNYERQNNENVFLSPEGNRYEWHQGKLYYFHRDGLNSMTFDKISDDFDGY